MHSAIIRLGGRGADQQSLEGLVSAELFEQKTDVIDQVKMVRKMGSNVVQICSGTLELPGSNRFENGHKGRLCGSEAPGVFGRPWHPTVGVLHGWSGLDDGSSLLHGIEVGQFRWRDVLRWSHLGGRRGDVVWLFDGVQIREFWQRFCMARQVLVTFLRDAG